MKNTINLEMNTELKSSSVKPLGLKIMSRDININEFMLKFKDSKGDDLKLDSTYKVEVLSVFTKSKTESLTPASILGTFAFWSFDTSLIIQEESVFNYVYVSKNGVPIVSADANGFWFNVGLSKVDEGTRELAKAYDYNYEKVLHEFEARVTMSVEEIEAVAVNEAQRQANEQTRKTNEANRIADENTRKANEDDRKAKEVVRQASYLNKATGIIAENLIVNGDFSQGVTGWSRWGNASLSEPFFKVQDGKLLLNGASNGNGRLEQNIMGNINDQLYIKMDFAGQGFINFVIYDYNASTGRKSILLNSDPVGTYSTIITSRAGGERLTLEYLEATSYLNRTVDNVATYNLTKIFGAGNEPTKVEMDAIIAKIGYFNGKKEIVTLADLHKGKASRKQGDWITPTLLNGATGDVQYRLNTLGELVFKGSMKAQNASLQPFILPTGYNPPVTVAVPVSSLNTTVMAKFTIGGSGSTFISTADNTYILNGITIQID